MVAALAEMPETMRERIKGLSVKHSAAHSSDGSLRRGFTEPVDAESAPGAIHPIIRAIGNGQSALYLGRRPLAHVVGLTADESNALLDELWAWCLQERFCLTHAWEFGQVVCWDNRRVVHSRKAFDERLRRTMWRTQVTGEVPIAAAIE